MSKGASLGYYLFVQTIQLCFSSPFSEMVWFLLKPHSTMALLRGGAEEERKGMSSKKE